MQLKAPYSVVWEVTARCNMNCAHCYIHSEDFRRHSQKELDTDESKRLITEIADLEIFNLSLSGGEPLVRKDILDLIRHCRDCDLNIFINTNGLLVDEKVAQSFHRIEVNMVAVSFDGAKKFHDSVRGAGSFEKAVNATRLLRDLGIDVMVSTVLRSDSIGEIQKVLELCLELDVNSIRILRMIPTSSNQLNLVPSPKQERRSRAIISNFRKKVGDRLRMNYNTHFGFVDKLGDDETESAKREAGLKPMPKGCAAATEHLDISFDGHILPCIYLRDMSAGRVTETTLKDAWYSSNEFHLFRNLTEKLSACQTCEYTSLCQGGCRALAKFVSGDIYGPDPHCPKIIEIVREGY